jgi:hypothetical protein
LQWEQEAYKHGDHVGERDEHHAGMVITSASEMNIMLTNTHVS